MGINKRTKKKWARARQLDHRQEGTPTPRLAIVADDLTGALDAAAPFGAVRPVVATRPQAFAEALASGAEIVGVSTRSREVAPVDARERVARVLAEVPAGIRVLKKIDSRLKGNIPAELDAFEGLPLVVLPAIPEFGRVVRDGALTGFGVEQPLPVRAALGPAGAAAHVPDVASPEEMAAAIAAAPPGAILVGARGMTQVIAAAMGLALPPQAATLEQPACIVVGSTDPITLAQVDEVRAARADVAWVAGAAGALPEPRDALGGVTLLQATAGGPSRSDLIAEEFARRAVPWLEGAASMLLTGGATAEAVLDALGSDLLSVEGEALPGMPRCRADGRTIVTKSGGFGAADAFLRLIGHRAEISGAVR